MSQPTAGAVHVNRPLTNISIAYSQEATDFVADRVFQNIPVEKQSDVYYTFPREYFFRDDFGVRAPGTESSGGGYEADGTASYLCVTSAFHHDIPDEIRRNSDYDQDRLATMLVMQKAMIRREVAWATKFFTTSVWAQDVTGVAGVPGANQVKQWNDAASTPINDIAAWRTDMKQNTGVFGNVLTMGQQVWDVLKTNPQIMDRIKYTGGPSDPAMITKEMVAALFEVDELLVMSATKVTSKEAAATGTYAFIGGKSALLTYRPPSPGIFVPAAGYTFSWTNFLDAMGTDMGVLMTKYRMQPIWSDRVEGHMSFDQKLVANALGRFFTTLIA